MHTHDTLQKMFDRWHKFLVDFSDRWKIHANRRTTIALLVVATVGVASYVLLIAPPGQFPAGQLVTIEDGMPLADVAANLQEEGVIRSALALRLIVRIEGGERSVHAGDYLFKEPVNIFAVARAIIVGAYGLEPIRIRVREGATTEQMAKLFVPQLQRFNSDRFLAAAKPLEGYLYPDTYFFLPNTTDTKVIETMRNNFDAHIATIAPEVASSTHPLSDIVIMASILEREAYNTHDRRMIAGVLWNRLAKGMPLQVDVTFLYTLGKGTFQLTMKDLTTPSPYNTYLNKGLPPTAIGSPSLDSLTAAATPIDNDYLYFLADRSGVTHYCKTWECQKANKARYF